MSVIYLLIGASLFVASGFLIAFLWAVKNGQFEDRYTPSIRLILEDKEKSKTDNKISKQKMGDATNGN